MIIYLTEHFKTRMKERLPEVPERNYDKVIKLALLHDVQSRNNDPFLRVYLQGLEKEIGRKAVASQRHVFILNIEADGYTGITVLKRTNIYQSYYNKINDRRG